MIQTYPLSCLIEKLIFCNNRHSSLITSKRKRQTGPLKTIANTRRN